MADFQYDQLDTSTRLNLVRARLKDVEQQHFSLSLRVNAPDLTVPVSEQDAANLARLTDSIARLRDMEKELTNTPPPQT